MSLRATAADEMAHFREKPVSFRTQTNDRPEWVMRKTSIICYNHPFQAMLATQLCTILKALAGSMGKEGSGKQ